MNFMRINSCMCSWKMSSSVLPHSSSSHVLNSCTSTWGSIYTQHMGHTSKSVLPLAFLQAFDGDPSGCIWWKTHLSSQSGKKKVNIFWNIMGKLGHYGKNMVHLPECLLCEGPCVRTYILWWLCFSPTYVCGRAAVYAWGPPHGDHGAVNTSSLWWTARQPKSITKARNNYTFEISVVILAPCVQQSLIKTSILHTTLNLLL